VVNNMEHKTQAIVVASLMVFLACTGVVLSLQGVAAEDVSTPTVDRQEVRCLLTTRGAIGLWFVRNGVPATLTGDVSVATRVLLVLDVKGKAVNVLVPRFWVVNGETMSIKDLFDGDPFSVGETAVLETLMVEWVKDTHTVTSYFAYAIQIGEETATALQPFNIDVVE
jgi:hypothetical protein